jgi:hypothetical protein
MTAEIDLPAQLAEQLQAQAAGRQHQIEEAEMAISQRRMILAWAPVFCRCRMSDPDSRLDCAVHGQIMLHYATGEIII